MLNKSMDEYFPSLVFLDSISAETTNSVDISENGFAISLVCYSVRTIDTQKRVVLYFIFDDHIKLQKLIALSNYIMSESHYLLRFLSCI